MAELTKEKILDLASEMIETTATFECLGENEDNWLKAGLFYNTGINEFARALIRALEG